MAEAMKCQCGRGLKREENGASKNNAAKKINKRWYCGHCLKGWMKIKGIMEAVKFRGVRSMPNHMPKVMAWFDTICRQQFANKVIKRTRPASVHKQTKKSRAA